MVKDEKGRFFIDRSPKQFEIILDWLRRGTLILPDSEMEKRELKVELDYFGLAEHAQTFVKNSEILSQDDFCQLGKWLSNGNKVELLYRGSRDGFDARRFHLLCDNKGPTLSAVKSTKGNVFGGFTSVSWNSSGYSFDDKNAFLFSLKGPLGANKFHVKFRETAVFCLKLSTNFEFKK